MNIAPIDNPIPISSGGAIVRLSLKWVEFFNEVALTIRDLFGYQGVDALSANNLDLSGRGSVFLITGTTQINALFVKGHQNGTQIQMIFAANPTVKNNTAGAAGAAVFRLAGGADFAATANDSLTVTLINGIGWIEECRSVN